jgi:virulence-associated protein VapD
MSVSLKLKITELNPLLWHKCHCIIAYSELRKFLYSHHFRSSIKGPLYLRNAIFLISQKLLIFGFFLQFVYFWFLITVSKEILISYIYKLSYASLVPLEIGIVNQYFVWKSKYCFV